MLYGSIYTLVLVADEDMDNINLTPSGSNTSTLSSGTSGLSCRVLLAKSFMSSLFRNTFLSNSTIPGCSLLTENLTRFDFDARFDHNLILGFNL